MLADVRPNMEIACAEVFGPVLAVQRLTDVDDMVRTANDNLYKFAASIWTRSLPLARTLAHRIKAGTVWINCHSIYDASLQIAETKQSGYDLDSGAAALDGYLSLKTVYAVL